MKRWIALLLLMAVLVGCAAPRPTEPSQETGAQTTAPTDPFLYYPGSAVELQTGGAVREYPLNGYCDGMVLLEDRVVLYYLDEQMQLKVFSGDTLTLDSVASHHIPFRENAEGLQITEEGIFYYDPGTRTAVILNHQLREKRKIELPKDLQGIPVISEDMDTVFYSTPDGIRALDLDSGIARMLRMQINYSGMLSGQCFDGSYLICQTTAADGSETTEFISAETGLLARRAKNIHWLDSMGDSYLLELEANSGSRYLYGTKAGELIEFLVSEGDKTVLPALEIGAVLTVTEEDSRYTMDLYQLETGLRTASVILEDLEDLRNVVADSRGYVWFMDDASLYRWDVAKSAVSDGTVYTGPWYTNQDPDEEGLKQCQTDAQVLGEKYGVEIRIWKDAVSAPWEKLIPEFQVDALEAALKELEGVLAQFPEGKLEEICSIYKNNKICFCIVADTGMDQGQVTWVDGNAYIAVETGNMFRTELLRTLYRVMDTYVLSKTSRLDEWDAEKPAEDRARYFMEAMTENNSTFFAKGAAQTKLRTLCRAIRDAFDMKEYRAELPWEQYLDAPLY